MVVQSFLQELGIMILAGAVFSFTARRIGVPSIGAYLCAGLVLGPVGGIITLSDSLEIISEAGIVLLLFLVGLELSFERIREAGKIAILAGIAQVLATSILSLLLNLWLNFSLKEAVFLAAALTFSSTVVVVKLLSEKKETELLYGRLAIGVLIIQDIVVILLLTFLSGFGDGAPEARHLGIDLLKAFGGMAVLGALVLTASRYWLPKAFSWASSSPDTLFIWSLCWCFVTVVAAHALHLSAESGAFLAGFSLAQLPYHQDLHRRVNPLMNFFIAVFFIALGIRMNLGAAFEQTATALALIMFVLVGKSVLIFAILIWLRRGRETAFLTGITLAQISEFSFILAAMGFDKGILKESTVSLVALVGLVTIFVSAFLINLNRPLFRALERLGLFQRFRNLPLENQPRGRPKSGHVIAVGMNTLGRKLVQALIEKGQTVVAIDTDPKKLRDLPCDTIIGDASYLPVLEEAGLPDAKLLISALRIEDANDLLAFRCKSFGVPCGIHAIDLSVMDNLMDSDVTYLMLPKVDGVKMQNQTLKELGFLNS